MTKTEAKKELQARLARLKAFLKEEVEDFAIEHELEFSFLGMKYFLKEPNPSGKTPRVAKRGIFISEAEWESSSWGCTESESYEAFNEWESKNFPYEDE